MGHGARKHARRLSMNAAHCVLASPYHGCLRLGLVWALHAWSVMLPMTEVGYALSRGAGESEAARRSTAACMALHWPPSMQAPRAFRARGEHTHH